MRPIQEPICKDFRFYELSFKVRSHQGKPNAKAEKIKEQSEEMKDKSSNIKENVRFSVRFRSMWTGL